MVEGGISAGIYKLQGQVSSILAVNIYTDMCVYKANFQVPIDFLLKTEVEL